MKQVTNQSSPFVRSDYLKLFMLVKKLIIRPIVVAQVLDGPWFESCMKPGINFYEDFNYNNYLNYAFLSATFTLLYCSILDFNHTKPYKINLKV